MNRFFPPGSVMGVLYQTVSKAPRRGIISLDGTAAAEDLPGVNRRTFGLFFLAISLSYFSALGTMPLLEPDEARYAEIPREMLVTGDFVTPHLNGVVYREKPPLFYWGNAVALRVLGENEFAARSFTALFTVAGILLTCWMGTTLSGWRTALFSGMTRLPGRAVPCAV